MNTIKIIAFDLDGTLLNSSKHVSEANARALEQCGQMGIHLVPATGRAASGIIPEIRNLKGVRYAITTNGGSVLDLQSGQILKSCRIPNTQAIHLMELLSRFHVMYDPYVEGRGKMEQSFYSRMDEFHLSPILKELIHATRDPIPDVVQYLQSSGKDVDKINVYLADQKDKEPLRRILMKEPDLAVSSSLVNNLEINAAQATKGNALTWLAEYLKVDPKATMAFGDGENDISMLRSAGVGVAMGNALEAAQKAAEWSTSSNDEDGIAYFLKQTILRQKETDKDGD